MKYQLLKLVVLGSLLPQIALGTSYNSEALECFKISDRLNTMTSWRVDLCAGTENAHAPIECFGNAALQLPVPVWLGPDKVLNLPEAAKLCGGTSNGLEPVKCYRRAIEEDMNYATAIALCAGTDDSDKTWDCYLEAKKQATRSERYLIIKLCSKGRG